MKKIALVCFLCAAVMLTGCKRSDNGSAPLTVTGTIAEYPPENSVTKVTLEYDEQDHQLIQSWELGDHIIGSYKNGSSVVDIDYKVIEIDNSTATFSKVGNFADPTEGTEVYALCLGQNGLEYDVTKNGVFDGDLTKKYYRTIMTATATVKSGVLSFEFENRAAVVGTPSNVTIYGDYQSVYEGYDITTTLCLSYGHPGFKFNNGTFTTTPVQQELSTQFILPVLSVVPETSVDLSNFFVTVIPDDVHTTTPYFAVDIPTEGRVRKTLDDKAGSYNPNYFYNLGKIKLGEEH